MVTKSHSFVMCFDYPVTKGTIGHQRHMEELFELLTDGWKVQGSPYVIGLSAKDPELGLFAQVLLIKD